MLHKVIMMKEYKGEYLFILTNPLEMFRLSDAISVYTLQRIFIN